ncbi:asparagine synthase-domain-containing protein [Dipodascopsis tothii]|uniref:asparagine synthase-domain-containing protein n=1 Tax=Dipodascopsis tothii TaxID=44089 RepID=UPI0034CD8A79
MCGIFCAVAGPGQTPIDADTSGLAAAIARRGPTCSGRLARAGAWGTLAAVSSVLALRGVVPQPLEAGPAFLQFNGELYTATTPDAARLETENDGAVLLEWIGRLGVLAALQAVRGEYAFVYFDGATLWYGRDCIGRRSLVATVDGPLAVASVPPAPGAGWAEVPAGAVVALDLATMAAQTHSWDGPTLARPYGALSGALGGDVAALAPELDRLLAAAVARRTQLQPATTVAVLFSGGLDCALVALMAARAGVRTLDLVNVAFENPRTGGGYATPDRKLGRRTWAELRAVLPDCDLRLLEIDVPFADAAAARPRVCELMWPKSSVMDLSIALAFYFAARASGVLHTADGAATAYTSPAPVLLSGLGADELFAGYTRHGTCQSRGGYAALEAELALDFGRLHERNLGRDDRVIADSGREARYPFLDEDVVAWALQCPLDAKFGPGAVPTKAVLRQVALAAGLSAVAGEPKRAIQFGARSAKMEPGQGKIKGTDALV